MTGFLTELKRDRDGERVLVIGHTATRLALDVVANGRNLEELVVSPFEWRPGWSTRSDLSGGDLSW
ncbi:MAG TPA: hypothetical protein VFU64_10115 [Gaiellaceae bacterium]|nr:hypothetical protein [Gaiellaceae bacterium]